MEQNYVTVAVCTMSVTDLVCDIVNDNDAMSTAVVAGRDGLESLLARCIPLQYITSHKHTTQLLQFCTALLKFSI